MLGVVLSLMEGTVPNMNKSQLDLGPPISASRVLVSKVLPCLPGFGVGPEALDFGTHTRVSVSSSP